MSRRDSVCVSVCVTLLATGCGYIADFDSPLPNHSNAGSAGENTRAGASNNAMHAGGVAGAAVGFPGGTGSIDMTNISVAGAGGTAGLSGNSSPSGGVSSTFVSPGGGTAGSSRPPNGGGTSTICAENESRNCSVGGLLGRCASGIQRCSSGQWSACSIAPAARDTCTPGNDDNCNGTPNDSTCSVLQLAAGASHTCALLSDGMVRCWGANNAGQLGNGTTILSGTPVLVSELNGVSSIEAGGDNTCAVLTDGSVRCWGQRSDGLIGETLSGASTTPTALPWSSTLPISTISVGSGFACAVTKAEATVRCWGRGDLGQLGDGIMHIERVVTPVMASGVSGVTSLSAGSSHVCAALSDTTVKCWGTGEYGQNGSSDFSSASIPTLLANHGYATANVTRVTAGNTHTCGLDTLGRASCWGNNVMGQLGVGDRPFGYYEGKYTQSAQLLDSDYITNAGGVAAISAGETHTCAVLADTSAICWGSNLYGQLGNGLIQPDGVFLPVQVSTPRGITSVVAGSGHTCATVRNNAVQCWGDNTNGQLGDATAIQRSLPTPVTLLLP